MSLATVSFDTGPSIQVPHGTLLTEAARQAGIEVAQPCGGQGRCGRCLLQVVEGSVHRRSSLRLSPADLAQGYVLACQTTVEGDCRVSVPVQEKIERRLTTDRTVAEIHPPASYDYRFSQSVRRFYVSLEPPDLDDQTDDWARLKTALRQKYGLKSLETSLHGLQRLGTVLRAGDWQVTVVLDVLNEQSGNPIQARLIDVHPGHQAADIPLWGAAIDIGTTTVTLWLVDLISGEVRAQVSEYNGQIARGEDVISRIVYSGKENGAADLRRRVLETINTLAATACRRQVAGDRATARPRDIVKAAIAGNSTMMHLLLGIPADSIRLAPYVPAVNEVPRMTAQEVGLEIHPDALIDCLPGVSSYVGADITAGILSSGMDDTPLITLFLDVGTNGEMALGSRDWLVTCACSAGPAFEGAGVVYGMRATRGAIEEVWINSETYEPTYRVIGGVKPRGLCGSGLISLTAELFMSGVVDKSGNVKLDIKTGRVRQGSHGPEYVIAWASESEQGEDNTITHVDIDNLLRAKAAIYAGFNMMAGSVGVLLEDVEQVLIGGSFGKYINVEKAVQIGLLPDLPWERFQFLGNTSVRGAYLALLDRNMRERLTSIASRMTYIELSADNAFYDAFVAALFLPHTDLFRFPTVEEGLRVRGELAGSIVPEVKPEPEAANRLK
jgi:uncharacterized 2Fe-2S/4Fe-4S cluster protein (DUF4445 family)